MFTGLMGRIVARLKRVPYVLNISDLWPDHLLTTGTLTESHPVYRVARWLVDTGYRGSAGIATMSEGWTEKVMQYLKGQSTEKVHTVLRGVDIDRFRPLDNVGEFYEKYDISPNKKWVTFLGTFATQYDFDLMLDATEHFVGRDDVGFLIVGTGSQRDKVAAALESGRLPNVQYMEWLAHEEMPLAWNVSYMTYWALRDEPLYYGTIPARTYEVLATGTPIVAAQGGIAADMIRASTGGLIVPPADKDAFIAAMTQVLDNPEQRDAMSVAGRAYAERELDFDVVARRYEAILMQAANNA
jgi:glycosyltransferase involved in cell wall biosynthesis